MIPSKKNTYFALFITIVFSLFLNITAVKAQSGSIPPPPPPGGHGSSNNEGAGAPIDGGLSIFLVLGTLYGAKKIHNRRKSDENQI